MLRQRSGTILHIRFDIGACSIVRGTPITARSEDHPAILGEPYAGLNRVASTTLAEFGD